MNLSTLLALELATSSLEEAKAEIYSLRTFIAILVERLGGETIVTVKEVEEFLERKQQMRATRSGDTMTYRLVPEGGECPCHVCQAQREATSKVTASGCQNKKFH